MKCNYCGETLSVEDKVCPLCGKVVSSTKKSHKGVLVLLIILLLGVIGGGYYYITRPDVVFTTLLNKVYKSANEEVEDYKQIKLNLDFNVNVDAGEEYKEITDLINNIKINSSFNFDATTEKFVLGLGADYKNKSLLNANMYYEEEMAYIELKDLFDKLIKVEVEPTEEEVEFTEEDINILIEEVYGALKNTLKVGEYTSSKAKVNDIDVNKNTLVINNENKGKLINTFVDYLLNSNDFIDTISKVNEMTKEEVIETLNYIKEEKVDLEEEIHVSIYTKILTNDFVKFEVGTKEEVLLSFVSESETVCIMEMTVEGTKVVATITDDVKNNKASIVFDMEVEGIKVKLTMNMSYVYNEKIEMPNTQNSVLMEELTEEDTNTIMTKLMENEGIVEIIGVIESMMPEEDYSDDSYVEYDDEIYVNDYEDSVWGY